MTIPPWQLLSQVEAGEAEVHALTPQIIGDCGCRSDEEIGMGKEFDISVIFSVYKSSELQIDLQFGHMSSVLRDHLFY